METGLYIVSTPIGNLKDITYRAVEILKEIDFIVCEDTRVTSILLNHYDIKKEMISFNAQSEGHKIEFVLSRIKNNQSCALLTDAGTPTISDPGVRLVSSALKEDIKVVTIPGPSALIAALSISGLPSDSFIFEGFLPQKKGRQKLLHQLASEDRTIILYESPYRIEKLLEELVQYMPDRIIVISRELTKKFEETWRGKPDELLKILPQRTIKGEFVIIISPISWKVE